MVGEFTTDGSSTSHNSELHITLPSTSGDAKGESPSDIASPQHHLYQLFQCQDREGGPSLSGQVSGDLSG